MNDNTELRFSVRTDLLDKPTSPHLLAKLRDGWNEHQVTDPKELFEILARRGFAVAPGIYRDGAKTKGSFLSGQIYLADFDNTLSLDDALQHPYLRQHFIGIYTTASHGTIKGDRFRAIGIFDEAFTTAEDYDAAVKAIRKALPGQDPAMGSAQACFGNRNAEVFYFDTSNRLPMTFEPKPHAPVVINQSDVTKALACLRVIPPRSSKGSGTYDDAINVVKVLVHEFGADKALELIDEAGWEDPSAEDWNIEFKVQSVQNYAGSGRLGLGSLIQIARRHASSDPMLLDQLERDLTGSISTSVTPLQGLMQQLLDVSCNVDDPDRWAKAKLIEAEVKRLGVSNKDIQRQKVAMLSARLGLDTAGLNAGPIRSLSC
jgi:hypothetical protein